MILNILLKVKNIEYLVVDKDIVYFSENTNCNYMTYRQLDTFYKQRIRPEFENGYYRSLIKDPKTMTMKSMKIRDSELTFRTASNGGSLEGLHVDVTALDEYDRVEF